MRVRHSLTVFLAVGLAACGSGHETDSQTALSDRPGDQAGNQESAAPASDQGVSAAAQPEYGQGDALVPSTKYHATTEIPCAFDGDTPRQRCQAGVIRNWGEAGSALVEVTKPDGRKRALFFKGIEPYGADSAQADGSAAYDFKVIRKDDDNAISFGPERYIVPDMLVVGD